MRTRACIDSNWRFELGDFPKAIEAAFDDLSWRLLDLPHDWSIEATPHPENPAGAGGGFFPGGIGWYRKRLEIPQDLGDRRVLIEFDGVYMNSEVWCNGHFCGGRPYGYSSFCYDLTPFIKAGQEARIAVRVDNSRHKNSRWYSGSGIYRHVWLTLAGAVRVDHWGTCVTTPAVSEERAVVECAVNVVNQSGTDSDLEVHAECLYQGLVVAFTGGKIHAPANVATGTNLSFDISEPRLWAPDTPHLYTLRVKLKQDGVVIDAYDTPFGIRSLLFDSNTGFFLNGKSLKFRGVNEHHDAGCLGAAIPDDVICRRLRILKEMGCNAIRVAHNPASPTLLDLCDEMGFLVVEDAFDEWKDGKTPFGYQLYWDQWWERDLADMIRRDRNHPCVVMWSVGNEIKEVRQGRPEGLPIMRALREVCHREDPTRPMTCGCCNSRETLAAGYGALMDVFGYNGGGGGCFDFEKDHAAYPAMAMFASEHPHTLQTRGVYRTKSWYRDLARNPGNVKWYPPESGVPCPESCPGSSDGKIPLELMHIPDLTEEEVFSDFDHHYQSSYGNAVVRMSIFDSWSRTRRLPFFCGEFRWTGFDYLGECYGWPAKSWNFGIIDLCGFPKDAYYFCQSQWTEAPMVHLMPHWTWPGLEGKVIPVIAYSNCETVELFLNGESLGVKMMDPQDMQLRWDVPYRPGMLKAVGRRSPESGVKAGETLATCVHETAGQPVAIRLVCDEPSLRADRTAVAHVVATVVDAQGRFVPNANPDISVEVEGAARLIGVENGDPIDSANYKLNHRKAFNGMMLAVVQAGDQAGVVTVRASARGLSGAACELLVKSQELGCTDRSRGDHDES
jgi:beta-galactosidase